MFEDPNKLEMGIATNTTRAACMLQGLMLLEEARVLRNKAEWSPEGQATAAMAVAFMLAADTNDLNVLTSAQKQLVSKREADIKALLTNKKQ